MSRARVILSSVDTAQQKKRALEQLPGFIADMFDKGKSERWVKDAVSGMARMATDTNKEASLEVKKAFKLAKKSLEDLEGRYLTKEPDRLGGFAQSVDKWTRGVDPEGREEAAYLFNNFRDLRNYLWADLITTMKWKFKTLSDFEKAKIKLYRAGTVQSGFTSFFLSKVQASSYAKRFGETVRGFETIGKNIIPTMSGSAEVFADGGLVK